MIESLVYFIRHYFWFSGLTVHEKHRHLFIYIHSVYICGWQSRQHAEISAETKTKRPNNNTSTHNKPNNRNEAKCKSDGDVDAMGFIQMHTHSCPNSMALRRELEQFLVSINIWRYLWHFKYSFSIVFLTEMEKQQFIRKSMFHCFSCLIRNIGAVTLCFYVSNRLFG